MKLKNLA